MANRFQVNIQIGAGVEFYQEYFLTEADGSPLDLSGCEVYGALAKHSSAKDVTTSTSEETFYKNLQFNAAVDDGVNGRISIYLSPTYTKMLEEGKYVYNVVAKNPSDDVIEVLSGLAFVNNAFANFNPLVPEPRN